VSTTAARHSRLKSSITFRIRNRRPQDRLSETKSRLHRWFGPCGIAIGDLVPKARFLPPLARQGIAKQCPIGAFAHGQPLLFVNPVEFLPVHRPAFRAAAEDVDADTRTDAAQMTVPSIVPAGQHLPIGLAVADRHADRSPPKRRPAADGIPSVSWPLLSADPA